MQITADKFIAHRGYQKYFPENTLLAFEEAIRAGARHIELDVQLSRDQVPVIYHDDTLERMSGRPGKISDCAAAELVQISAHEPERFGERFVAERIAPLSALVAISQRAPQVTFYVEIKEEAVRDHGSAICLRQIAAVLKPVLAQCVLISFDLAVLADARCYGFKRIGPVLRDWKNRESEITRLGASVIFINKKRIPVGERVEASCPVALYEIGDAAEAKQWLQRGAAMVETFAIGELIPALCRATMV